MSNLRFDALLVLVTTPQRQSADAQYVKWLLDHQKEAGVFATVSRLVDQLSDNPAAKMTVQEIAQRWPYGGPAWGRAVWSWRLALACVAVSEEGFDDDLRFSRGHGCLEFVRE